MDVRDCRTVFIDHHVAVVHPYHLLLHCHDGGKVPKYQKAILTTNNDLALMDGSTQNLRLMLQTFHTFSSFKIVQIEALIISK